MMVELLVLRLENYLVGLLVDLMVVVLGHKMVALMAAQMGAE